MYAAEEARFDRGFSLLLREPGHEGLSCMSPFRLLHSSWFMVERHRALPPAACEKSLLSIEQATGNSLRRVAQLEMG